MKNVSYNSLVLKRQKRAKHIQRTNNKNIYSQFKNRNYKTESLSLKKEGNKNVRMPYVKIAFVRFVKRND